MSTLLCSGCEGRLSDAFASVDRVSPTPQLFGTNKAPSPAEARVIEEYLLDIQGEIDQIQSQILQAQSILASLHSQREKLKSFAHKHRQLLSPLRRLFPELLSEIFSWCPKGAPTRHPFTQIPDSFHPNCGPLLLSQICRSWRSAAITTPDLWTTIRLVLRSTSKLRVPLLDLFLSRSGDCDLFIGVVDNLDASDDGLAAQTSHLSELRTLAREAHRWKFACLSLPSSQIYWDALSEAKGKTNRLDNLAIFFSQYSRPGGVLVVSLANIPQLASLSHNSFVSMRNLLLDNSKITRFRYEKAGAPLDLCVEAMRSLPKLEHCTLHCLVLSPSSSTILPIYLPDLRNLDIRIDFGPGTHRDQAGAFWGALQIPNLSSLRVDALYHSPVQISRLFQRSQNLKKLTIIWKTAEAEELLDTIQHATAITSLSLGLDGDEFLPVISSLAPTDETPSRILFPDLKVIRIYPVEIEDFLDFRHDGTVRLSSKFLVAFIQMAQARMIVARNSRMAPLDTALLHHPAHSEAAVEVVNRYMHAMRSRIPDQSPLPIQVHYSKLSGGSGGIVKIQRSSQS